MIYSHWNYRVVKSIVDDEPSYAIHEVYYTEGDVPKTISHNPMFPFGDTIDDLKLDLQKMIECLEKPVLNIEDFGSPLVKITETT
jgi:hypothetical protein